MYELVDGHIVSFRSLEAMSLLVGQAVRGASAGARVFEV